jgi:phosphoenolpyruvate-protein phosphotransferase/dihydroxyacetone kinase phosphotransfer subunit
VVGIVLVSHSARLADGVAEVAREMGGEVRFEVAGGLRLDEPALGTDAALVAEAIERAYSDDGVVVLMDLGSAVLSAEMALDLLPPGRRDRVVLCPAPMVEGAVAAAAVARTGASLEEVAAEASGALRAKLEHLGEGEAASPREAPAEAAFPEGPSIRLVVKNPLGLHARPAARFVQTVGRFDAEVSVQNMTTGKGPGSGRSLNALATLGVRQGHEVVVFASGPQAAEALAALQTLADRDFDDRMPAPPPTRLPPPAPLPAAGAQLSGLPASPGIVVGQARHFRLPPIQVPTHPAGDPEAEWQALEGALEVARREIRAQRSSVAARAGEEEAAILDAHALFLEDDLLVGAARRGIVEERRNAAQAWRAAADAVIAEYRALEDEYLQARAEDLAGVARRVLEHLLIEGPSSPSLAGAGIVVAANLTPTDTVALDPALVRGIATVTGGPTSHSAILARSLGIPAVVGVGDALLGVPEGTLLILDGDAGAVLIDPSSTVTAEYEARGKEREARERAARKWARRPAVTLDGARIEVAANVGSLEETEVAVAAGADGIGLLRTEFLFLDREAMPDEEEQEAAYRRVADVLAGRPLIVRTLDVGADKPLPYLPRAEEDNPFLGVRGIRLGLARPELLSIQLRAALRVAADHPVKVMFPMVTTVEELEMGLGLVTEARSAVGWTEGWAPEGFEFGAMVEVPAAALVARPLAAMVDFFSIGTNDLSQYVAAADRGNDRVATLADALHPAVLRLVRMVVEAADTHGRWVGVCGEVAGDPVAVPILLGLGVRELSVAPPAVAAIKQAVREADLGQARALAVSALGLESAGAVRALLSAPAEAGGPTAASGS